MMPKTVDSARAPQALSDCPSENTQSFASAVEEAIRDMVLLWDLMDCRRESLHLPNVVSSDWHLMENVARLACYRHSSISKRTTIVPRRRNMVDLVW